VAAKTAEIGGLRAAMEAEREMRRRLELQLAELERRLGMDSTDSGTPSSKERIGAKEGHEARQQSERERCKDRKRGGQPDQQGKGPKRNPDPDDMQTADPWAEYRASLDGAESVESRWSRVIDVEILRKAREYPLPGLKCGGCGAVAFAEPPPGLHAGAVLLSCYENVPAERSAQLIGMLTGEDVSARRVDKAAAGVNARLKGAGFDDAMTAALAAEDVLAADENPVNVLDKTPVPAPEPDVDEADPEEKDGKTAAGAPHVLIVTTQDGQLRLRLALDSRHKGSAPAAFTENLMTDGYIGYQRLRDWDTGNHPGYSLGTWLRDYRNRSSYSPATSPWTGRITPASAERRPPNAIRRSRAAGVRSRRSPSGVGSTATWTPPLPMESPHSTPSTPSSRESPGYRYPPSAESKSRHPVNGHSVASSDRVGYDPCRSITVGRPTFNYKHSTSD